MHHFEIKKKKFTFNQILNLNKILIYFLFKKIRNYYSTRIYYFKYRM